MRRLFGVAAVALAVALVGACTPTGTASRTPSPGPESSSSAPAPSATPSQTCLGTGGVASPRPCDDQAREAEKRDLEEQAKAVYARYWKEYTRLLESGGATEATPELKATVAEPMLANVVSLLKYQKDRGWMPKPFLASYTIQVQPTQLRSDSEVTVIACEDTRQSVIYDPSGQRAGQGVMAVQVRALKRIDGALMLYDEQGRPEESQCPFG